MSGYLILALAVAGVIGWFSLIWIFGIIVVIMIIFMVNGGEIEKLLIGSIGGILLVGGLCGYGLQFYLNEYEKNIDEPQSKMIVKDGKQYELKYVLVDVDDEDKKIIKVPKKIKESEKEISFWESVKTYKPFGENE